LSLTNRSTAPGGRAAPFAAYQSDVELAAAPEAITPFIKRLRVRFNFTIYIRLHLLILLPDVQFNKVKFFLKSIDNDSHLHYTSVSCARFTFNSYRVIGS
jgi:hypothetical protein